MSARVKTEASPLQQQVNRAALLIAAIAIASAVVFFVAGITLAGLPLEFALIAAIGLLVGNVPEGLLPTITLSLAGGVRRMARKQALVKRLTAVETLGSTDVICTDKTGTLTAGHMAVRLLWVDGDELAMGTGARRPTPGPFAFMALAQTAVRCNNATLTSTGATPQLGGDPSESALLAAARELGHDVVGAQARREALRRKVYAFDPRAQADDDARRGDRRRARLPRQGRAARAARALREHPRSRPGCGRWTMSCAPRWSGRSTATRAQGLRVLGFAQRTAPEPPQPWTATPRSPI